MLPPELRNDEGAPGGASAHAGTQHAAAVLRERRRSPSRHENAGSEARKEGGHNWVSRENVTDGANVFVAYVRLLQAIASGIVHRVPYDEQGFAAG